MVRARDLAAEHVAAFNKAVAGRDFTIFLNRFSDDAVMRFENVPGVGVIEYAGREAFTAGYTEHPPDDEIRIAAPVHADGATTVIPFVWQRDGGAGVMQLTQRDGLIARMVVIFGSGA